MSDDASHDNTGFDDVEADATERTSPIATQAPEGWDDQFPEDEFDEPTPRSRLPLITKVLAAILVCGLFFTAGSFAQKTLRPQHRHHRCWDPGLRRRGLPQWGLPRSRPGCRRPQRR